jgi:hypothetical protein
MAVQKISFWLTTPAEVKGLTAKVDRLTRLQQVFRNAVPPQLACACRVTNLRAGTLVIMTDNQAVAAKLRQLVPSLLNEVQKFETEVTGIQVQAQVKSATNSIRSDVTERSLPTDIVDKFEALSETVADAELRGALTRLVRRRSRNRPRSGYE